MWMGLLVAVKYGRSVQSLALRCCVAGAKSREVCWGGTAHAPPSAPGPDQGIWGRMDCPPQGQSYSDIPATTPAVKTQSLGQNGAQPWPQDSFLGHTAPSTSRASLTYTKLNFSCCLRMRSCFCTERLWLFPARARAPLHRRFSPSVDAFPITVLAGLHTPKGLGKAQASTAPSSPPSLFFVK